MQPDDPRIQLAQSWLHRAGLDLRLARLSASDPSLAGLTSFHCQQAAAKALKAFLGWSDQPLMKTHDLPALLSQCQAVEPRFIALQHAARTLDVYLTAGRYPDVGPMPSAANAAQALELAEEALRFVTSLLPRQPTST